MRTVFDSFVHDARGATAVEYSLMVALIALALIGGLNNYGFELTNLWSNNSDSVGGAMKGG